MITAKVFVTLKRGVLDPQGQAVARSLGRLGFDEVKDARIGKYIELQLDGDRAGVEARLTQMCERLLANTVIEEYRFELVEHSK
jgi:phosphoribosylformylglycinamidine synthase